MGHKDSCVKCTGKLADSCDAEDGIFICTELKGHEGWHRACSHFEHPAHKWERRTRCTFKIELVGVTFQCQGDIGHRLPCWNEPEGCGGDVRMTWTPDMKQVLSEIKKSERRA